MFLGLISNRGHFPKIIYAPSKIHMVAASMIKTLKPQEPPPPSITPKKNEELFCTSGWKYYGSNI